MRKRTPAIDRALKQITYDEVTGCWLGHGTHSQGYSQVYVYRSNGTRSVAYAHRLTYSYFRGPLTEGLIIDHLCRRNACMNPWHLEEVTYTENVRRGLNGVLHTRCIRGHAFTSKNVTTTKRGNRYCNICSRMNRQRARDINMAKGLTSNGDIRIRACSERFMNMNTKSTEETAGLPDTRRRSICFMCAQEFVAHCEWERYPTSIPEDCCIWCYYRSNGTLYRRFRMLYEGLKALSEAHVKVEEECECQGCVTLRAARAVIG